MSIKMKSALLLTTLFALMSMTSRAAEDNAGVIHFTGEIIEPSCVIHGDSGTDSTVPLGSYPTSEFAVVGDESDLVPFTIQLDSCPVASDGLPSVQLTFTGATTVTGSTTLLDVSAIAPPTGGVGDAEAATGVGIAVTPKDKNTNYIAFDGTEGQIYVPLSDTPGDAIYAEFNARYKSYSDTITAGPADADMTINILYR